MRVFRWREEATPGSASKSKNQTVSAGFPDGRGQKEPSTDWSMNDDSLEGGGSDYSRVLCEIIRLPTVPVPADMEGETSEI